ncbi:S8 family serine peptidase [Catenuloplanes atrovinosus]|uniref:Subtilisin family serine protease n=1 Tax=Catenuloplanes atrovinosus TaxID=137266 RepID=A0AAE4CBE5_9ACTN|nr:S8 family serine peptidase [Catenuloplanes atrovinosus]MDR7277993.1 subtilisin family serine protease [Catenuloplanes atrovinosus]
MSASLRRLLVLPLLLAALAGALRQAPVAAAETGAETPGVASAETHTVTLITGDRVTVTAGDKVSVLPGPGRSGTIFLTDRDGGRLTVTPADALPLVRTGRLDPRLFQVSTLIEFGYDDRRADLPLIASYDGGGENRPFPGLSVPGATVRDDLTGVDAVLLSADRSRRSEFWTAMVTPHRTLAAGLGTLWLDGVRQPTLTRSVPQIGAPAAWEAGYDGAGATVAVLDSGVDDAHPALTGRVTGRANLTEGAEDARDHTGHGTHVASTVAAVAPGASLLDAKVCVDGGCAESWILAGMEWAAARGATVANLSLGGPDTPGTDPLEAAIGKLTGTLFVVAAGNTPLDAAVNSPATADAALAVGAVDGSDRPASFSARGPRPGDGALKPELVAPGVDITAARAGTGGTVAMSGTSMAAPHVSGAAALLAQRHPGLPSGALRGLLVGSATPLPDVPVVAQGAGRVDVARAVRQAVVPEPAVLNLGRAAWPHEDDPLITRTVTYRNTGSSDLGLDLAVSGFPAGMARVDPATLTVPAGGVATATVTVDTRTGGATGLISGRLTASGELATPIVLDRETESYDVTVAHVGRDGAPLPDYRTLLARADGTVVASLPAAPDGVATVRVPAGSYALMGALVGPGPDGVYGATLLAQPALTVSGPLRVTLDARQAAPVSVRVPAADAVSVFGELATTLVTPDRTVEVGTFGGSVDGFYAGAVGPAAAQPGFVARVSSTWTAPGASDSPYVYQLGWLRRGTMMTGFDRTVTPQQLATVRADHARESTAVTGRKSAWPVLPGTIMGGFAHPLPFALPFTRTEFYNTDGGASWFRSLDEIASVDGVDVAVTSTVAPSLSYRAGVSAENWSRGVFAPSVESPPYDHQWVTREGDTLHALAPLYGDAAGRAGYSALATGTVTVTRDGAPLASADGTTAEFTLPPEPSAYRLEVAASRGGPAVLSTDVHVAWTFGSAHTDTLTRMPLSTVRFAPPVDTANAAPAGRRVTVPVSVHAQPGSAATANARLTVEVSYDDGTTWTPAPVTAGAVTLDHPPAPGYVSLRATASDTAGNGVVQTVIRAYRTA